MSIRLKLITSAAGILVLLSGCEKKVGGQVVAVVNGEEITQQELNAELQGARVPASADQKRVMAALLQRVVERKLLAHKAVADGLDKSPEYLAQYNRAREMLLINLLGSKVSKGISLPDPAAVDRFITDKPTIFAQRKRYSLDQIRFPQSKDMSILKKLEPAHSLDAVAATLTAAGIQFSRNAAQLDTANVDPAIVSKINALPPGEPFIVPADGKVVASVVKGVEAIPVLDQQAKPGALAMLRQKALDDAMQKQLEAARTAAKIEYQPGFAPPKASTAAPAKKVAN